jgi:thioredoxin reductase (NADPH)
MSQEETYDVVIVGGGPGGLSAAIYAMRAALRAAIVEKTAPGGQMLLSEEVENYPGIANVGGAELAMNLAEHARSYGIEEINDEVVAIEPGLEYHTVKLADGRSLTTHAVIMASGGSPRKLKVPGEDSNYGRGVSYCAVCDGFFFRDKTVVVVGGGDSACEEGLYLAKLAKQVYLIHRRDELRASKILQERVMAECKMEVLWNSVVDEIKATQEGVASVILQDTVTGEKREQPTDGCFIFIGFEPNNQLVPAGVKLNAEGFVEANDKCETSIPGIYVVGDLRERYARQIVLAAADGCMAALVAAHYVENRKAVAADSCELPA